MLMELNCEYCSGRSPPKKDYASESRLITTAVTLPKDFLEKVTEV